MRCAWISVVNCSSILTLEPSTLAVLSFAPTVFGASVPVSPVSLPKEFRRMAPESAVVRNMVPDTLSRSVGLMTVAAGMR